LKLVGAETTTTSKPSTIGAGTTTTNKPSTSGAGTTTTNKPLTSGKMAKWMTLLGLVRQDGKCGPQNLIDGKPGQCNPYGNSPCCSPKGYCGITVDHCRGIDYRVKDLVRKDGRCGPDFPINGKPGQCSPYGNSGWCCSPHVRLTGGWCGSTWNHCKCANCIDYRKADKVVSLPHNKSLLGYDDRKYLPRPAPELGQKPQPPASLRPLEQEPQPPTSLRPVEQEPQPPTSL